MICVAVSSAAGSILYGLWALLEQRLTKEEHIQALQNGINVVVILFSLLAAGALGLCTCLTLSPGYALLVVSTKTVKDLLELLGWVWIFGAVWRLGLYFRQVFRLGKQVANGLPGDKQMRRILSETCRQMGIQKNIEIRQSVTVPTPGIEGCIHPRIYLPAVPYEEDVLRAILYHELTHYRNRDRWIRYCALILGCIHWFNPLVKRMHRDLDRWDEYYCDYLVCCHYNADKMTYIQALMVMAEYIVDWQERWERVRVMELSFATAGDELIERIDRMMKYQGKGKQKGLLSVALCIVFVLLGSSTVLAAGAGLNEAYGELMHTTYTTYAEDETQLIEENTLQEYQLSPKEAAMAEALLQSETGGAVQPAAQPTATISARVQDSMWHSGAFYAYSGQNILVSVALDPEDIDVKVGIIEPDGTWRFVEGCKNITHTFVLDQTGYYQLFVWNETDTSVSVIGYYATQSGS